ncbi:ABC-2 type transport system permease protein [Bacillus ectoiniformans]|uniref:ABC transporter permease n=1 Tax=Bacillus ectoiniformans TaxID=1494429 RepID=UPI00195EFA2A|nr:ABC transporter permease [Bacillus ectoiniformans]MBM7647607.1 ABC-2 type transport system permease protein [Bacillus ectoiniformans]
MNTIQELWKQRLDTYYNELRKYLKYMLNDHLLFVLVFGMGAGLYYYSDWVKTLDPAFPAPLIMAAVLGAVLAWSPVYTFLKRADTVFLLPLEGKMKGYFQNAILTSFISQSYVLILLLAVFMPMYVQVKGGGFQSFFLWLLILAGLKLWNLSVRFLLLKLQERQSHYIDMGVRFALNTLLLYFIVSGASDIFALIVAAVMMLYFVYFNKAVQHKSYKWETLVDLEEKRMAAFYRLANMFTDVPHLRGEVKRRQWMDALIGKMTFDQTHSFSYLLKRTFVRMNEYFGLFVRLTVIAGLIIYFSDQPILQVIIALLFIYLTGFQLMPMIRRHQTKIWLKLYPLPAEQKRAALLNLILQVLVIQAVIFGIASAISHSLLQGVIVLGAGLLLALLFVKMYAPPRLKKLEQRL